MIVVSPTRSRAFTLVELTAVLALSAVLAVVAVVSLHGASRAARLSDVVPRLSAMDRWSREYARRFDRGVQLTFDLANGRVLHDVDGNASSAAYELPSGCSIERVATSSGDIASGEASIAFSAKGHTRSYAVMVSGRDGRRSWVIFAGLTGQAVEVSDERQVRETIAATGTAAGTDAR